MNIYELPTPLVLVDISRLFNNLRKVFESAKTFGKKIWPMSKSHKSSYIAFIQSTLGADGFTVGTIDEAEVLVEKGLAKAIMLGNVYVADRESLSRVIDIAEQGVRVILRLDNLDVATFVDSELGKYRLKLDYVVKVDVGLHRFGVRAENVVKFVKSLKRLENLNFIGVVTHPGHVYSCLDSECVARVARETSRIMASVALSLRNEGFDLEIIGTGSTPTIDFDLKDPTYTHLFPGNFVYYDRVQAEVFGSAKLDDCALTVLTTVVSIPEHSGGRLAVVNVGSKYLGLDRGAHGVELVRGFGRLVEHPKVLVVKLSEEVGVIDIEEDNSIRVGEKVRVIPNHACVVSNATSYIVFHENERVLGLAEVDMRNSTRIPKSMSTIPIVKPRDYSI